MLVSLMLFKKLFFEEIFNLTFMGVGFISAFLKSIPQFGQNE
jgi:hypothetical protein